MSFLKSRRIIDCESLVGENVGFIFRGEGFNVGEGYSFSFIF